MKLLSLLVALFLFCGCTISLQNVMTDGTASDLIDEEQTASPDVKTDLSIPAMAM